MGRISRDECLAVLSEWRPELWHSASTFSLTITKRRYSWNYGVPNYSWKKSVNILEDEFLLIYLKTIWTEWCVYMVHSQTVYRLRIHIPRPLPPALSRSLKKLRIQNHLFAIGKHFYCRIERFAAYCWFGRRWLMWVDFATYPMDSELLGCCLWSSLLK